MNSQSSPLISILMPIHNTEKYLAESIESVLSQTYQNWELICINDGSTDSCGAILKDFKLKDSRIIVLEQKKSGTAAGARNSGLRIAKGEFIALLDSDDKYEKEYLSKLTRRYNETNADIILASAIYWKYDTNTIVKSITGIEGDINTIESGKKVFLSSLKWGVSAVGLINKKLFDLTEGYDTIGMNGDEYTARLLFLNSNFIAFSKAQYYYRLSDTSTTKKFSIKRFDIHHTNYRIFQLIKTNNFGNKIINKERERLFKSLLSNYHLFITKRNLLTKNELEYAKFVILRDTQVLYHEYKSNSSSESNLKGKLHKFILSDWRLSLLFSVKWSLYTFIKAKVKGLQGNNMAL